MGGPPQEDVTSLKDSEPGLGSGVQVGFVPAAYLGNLPGNASLEGVLSNSLVSVIDIAFHEEARGSENGRGRSTNTD